MTQTVAVPIHDAHVHLWSNPPPHPNQLTQMAERIPVDGTPEELLAAMDRVGIGRAAVVTPSAMGWDNSATMAAAQAYPDRLVPVGRVDIQSPASARTLAVELAAGMRGIRVGPIDGSADELLDRPARDVWSVVADAGVPAALHILPDQLGAVHRVANARPGVTFLLDHLGRPDVDSGVAGPAFRSVLALADCDNMVVKAPNASYFSRVGPPYADLADFISASLETFGPSRVMWGSDWPLCAVDNDYGQSLEPTAGVLAEWTEKERELVLSGNFERVYPQEPRPR